MTLHKLAAFFFMMHLFLLSSILPTHGRDVKTKKSVKEKNTPAQQQAPVEKKDVKLFIDKIEIEGRLEKPQVMLFLPGQTPEIDDIQIDRSFMKDIFRPVEKRITVETKYRTEYSKNQKSVIEW